MLLRCSAKTKPVRVPADLDGLHGLVIPGGESTAITRLMQRNGLWGAIKKKHKKGMAVYGSCAGAILVAGRILSRRQPSLGLIGISVERNAYGRQADSFETELMARGLSRPEKPFPGVFIRAPSIEKVGSSSGVEVLAEFNKKPVMVLGRRAKVLATTFHPELTTDTRVHELFLRIAGI